MPGVTTNAKMSRKHVTYITTCFVKMLWYHLWMKLHMLHFSVRESRMTEEKPKRKGKPSSDFTLFLRRSSMCTLIVQYICSVVISFSSQCRARGEDQESEEGSWTSKRYSDTFQLQWRQYRTSECKWSPSYTRNSNNMRKKRTTHRKCQRTLTLSHTWT